MLWFYAYKTNELAIQRACGSLRVACVYKWANVIKANELGSSSSACSSASPLDLVHGLIGLVQYGIQVGIAAIKQCPTHAGA